MAASMSSRRWPAIEPPCQPGTVRAQSPHPRHPPPRSMTMRYGFYLPTRGASATPQALEALLQRGEALGFDSVMIADHVVFPTTIASKYPYTVSGVFPGQGDALEQLALMAFVAAKTERLRLVTSVMILPY